MKFIISLVLFISSLCSSLSAGCVLDKDFVRCIDNDDIQNRIEFLIEGIENAESFAIQNRKMIRVGMATQLSVELEVLRSRFVRYFEGNEECKRFCWDEIYKSSNAEEIKSYLESIHQWDEENKLLSENFGQIENLKRRYCDPVFLDN